MKPRWIGSLTLILLCSMLETSSAACSLPETSERWIYYGSDASVQCRNLVRKKWWNVSDPCNLNKSTEFRNCSSTSSFCQVSSEQYLNMEACVVCCTDESVTELSQDNIHSCEQVKVCPVVHVTIPSMTTTGGTVNIQTMVTTKPRPQSNRVSVYVMQVTANSTHIPLASSTDGEGHRVPATLNNYSFFHSISIPWDFSAEDQVEVTIDTTAIDRGSDCGADGILFVENLHVFKVNKPTEAMTSKGTSAPSSSEIATPVISTSDPPSRVRGFVLDYPSLSIGAAVGFIVTVLVLLVLLAVWWVRHKLARSHSKSSSLEVTGHHLLTANGTPATTPSSCEKRVLGYTSPQDTPATTPTEGDSLLNGTCQQAPLNSPPLLNSTAQYSNPTSFTTEFTGPAVGRMMTEQPRPTYPPPSMLHARSPPTSLPGPPRPIPTLNPPQLSHSSHHDPPQRLQHNSSDARPSTLDPAYFTHGEAIYLSKSYNNDPGIMV